MGVTASVAVTVSLCIVSRVSFVPLEAGKRCHFAEMRQYLSGMGWTEREITDRVEQSFGSHTRSTLTLPTWAAGASQPLLSSVPQSVVRGIRQLAALEVARVF